MSSSASWTRRRTISREGETQWLRLPAAEPANLRLEAAATLMQRFTFHRLWAIVLKEFVQMRRDRVTFAMMIGIPLLQLTLFGFAINSDPKHLPTALRAADHGPFARTLVAAL